MPFDPELHPRGPDGRFITKGAAVKELTSRLGRLSAADLAEAKRLITKLGGKLAHGAKATKLTGTNRIAATKTSVGPTKEAIDAEIKRRGLGDKSTADKLSGIPYAPAKDEIDTISGIKRQQMYNRLVAESDKNVTIANVKKGIREADEHAQELVDGASQFVAVSPNSLDGILSAGRFKTQFETGMTEGGGYDPEFRRKAENKFAGVPTDIAPELRPIYGYLSNDENGSGSGTDGYGIFKVQLKDSVRDRSTVTFGDSLFVKGSAVASPLNKVSSNSVGDLTSATFWNASNIQDAVASGVGQTVEIQVHGGLSASDIAVVHVPQAWAKKNAAKLDTLSKVLSAKGIKLSVTGRLTGKNFI